MSIPSYPCSSHCSRITCPVSLACPPQPLSPPGTGRTLSWWLRLYQHSWLRSTQPGYPHPHPATKILNEGPCSALTFNIFDIVICTSYREMCHARNLSEAGRLLRPGREVYQRGVHEGLGGGRGGSPGSCSSPTQCCRGRLPYCTLLAMFNLYLVFLKSLVSVEVNLCGLI